MLRRIVPAVCVIAANLCICLPQLLAQRTSANTPLLKQALQQHPDADANHDGILTEEEAQAYLAKMGKGKKQVAEYEVAPTRANVKYGPYERNVLDLWLAKRDDGKPTPLAIFMHPGAFTVGDKSKLPTASLRQLLAAGISVASINYRLLDSGPFPAPMLDGARAIQFLRYHADEYHLRKDRVACFGVSAGACMSMWLAFHDDLADPKNPDPVLRESTRLTCAAPGAGQSSLDMKTIGQWFHCDKLQEHPSLRGLFGIKSLEELEKPEIVALVKEASPITHLTADDPPIFASFSQADAPVDENTPPATWAHHPQFGIMLKKQMDRLHVECHLQYKGGPADPQYPGPIEFLIDKLNK
jgi:acetyl esterase/lipase